MLIEFDQNSAQWRPKDDQVATINEEIQRCKSDMNTFQSTKMSLETAHNSEIRHICQNIDVLKRKIQRLETLKAEIIDISDLPF